MHADFTLLDGAQIAYTLEGEGPALVLLSGLGGTASFWRPLQQQLALRYRVLAFDQRGMGQSTAGSLDTTLDQLTEDARQIIDTLLPHEPLILIGHSTGGVLVQQLAAQDPTRLERLVLSGSWMEPDAHMRYLFHVRQQLLHLCPELYGPLSTLLSYKSEPNDNAFWEEQYQAVSSFTTAQQQRISKRIDALLSFSGRTLVPTLSVPTLVVGSYDDLVVPFHHQEQLAENLPLATLQPFENGGHFFPRTRTEQYLRLLSAWLAP